MTFKICLLICLLTMAFVFLLPPSTVSAQPAMSRGEQRLSITYGECIQRAENAFTKEGWVNIGKGGAYVNAFKGNHGAYIMCNVAPENKTWVNIVVASLSHDSEVPGAERVKLQKWMDQPGAANRGDDSYTTWTWAYASPGQQPEPHGEVRVYADGRAWWSGDGRWGKWSRSGDQVIFDWRPQNSTVDTLYLSRDGTVMTGTNRDGWNIRATQRR